MRPFVERRARNQLDDHENRIDAIERRYGKADSYKDEGFTRRPTVNASMPVVARLDDTGSGYSLSGSSTTSTHYTNFDATTIELKSKILDADLPNDKIIVKDGCSGLYRIRMLGGAEFSWTGNGALEANAWATVGGSGAYALWSVMMKENNYDTTAPELVMHFTSAEDVFVDASLGDVDIICKYDLDGTVGTAGIWVTYLSVELRYLTKDVTP